MDEGTNWEVAGIMPVTDRWVGGSPSQWFVGYRSLSGNDRHLLIVQSLIC